MLDHFLHEIVDLLSSISKMSLRFFLRVIIQLGLTGMKVACYSCRMLFRLHISQLFRRNAYLYPYLHLLLVIAKRDKDGDFNSDRTEASMPGPTSRCSLFPSFIMSGVDNQLSFFFSVPSYLCILVRKLTSFLCIIMEYFL
ncbi:hypothetical protein VPH35_110254 [Triticum aestivum]|uniref:Uncharacterized protein n=1 Tax=Triticum turgidum subsp. durum TaxID=4567 RepID=A0A9R0YJV5_TRITD|nr:unnamed protein product [Triticum turgidum subsp. durum]